MIDTQKVAPPFIVCTDLDGTLLDHHTYSWQAAKTALATLEKLGVPVIINTSKTFAEVHLLQKDIGITAPFIVENGSAVYLPKSQFNSVAPPLVNEGEFWLKILGRPCEFIRSYLNDLRKQNHFKFEGYADWPVEKIMALTGLNLESAKLSHDRRYSEPLIWQDTESQLDQFKRALENKNLKLLKGGRFFHALGNCDKGSAISWLRGFYGAKVPVVCLGDSDNDIDMLEVADIPVLVKSPTRDYPQLKQFNHTPYKTHGFGPEGWAEAIDIILTRLITA